MSWRKKELAGEGGEEGQETEGEAPLLSLCRGKVAILRGDSLPSAHPATYHHCSHGNLQGKT